MKFNEELRIYDLAKEIKCVICEEGSLILDDMVSKDHCFVRCDNCKECYEFKLDNTSLFINEV